VSAGGSVIIDYLPSSAARYVDRYAIVAIDVIRAATMAVTAVADGRRCIVAADLADALAIRDRIGDAVLAGELGGERPDVFEMNNSPADLALRTDVERPLVMLSSSGTQLMLEAGKSAHGGYVACFRNLGAVARHLIGRHRRVAVIGAGSRNEFREEDQMGCAWLAEILVAAGYRAENGQTTQIIHRWRGAAPTACETGHSVDYLRSSGQLRDFDFIVGHVDDLDLVCTIEGNEIRGVPEALPLEAAGD
jgi:2-phosphosulfolactate phosphatase